MAYGYLRGSLGSSVSSHVCCRTRKLNPLLMGLFFEEFLLGFHGVFGWEEARWWCCYAGEGFQSSVLFRVDCAVVDLHLRRCALLKLGRVVWASLVCVTYCGVLDLGDYQIQRRRVCGGFFGRFGKCLILSGLFFGLVL